MHACTYLGRAWASPTVVWNTERGCWSEIRVFVRKGTRKWTWRNSKKNQTLVLWKSRGWQHKVNKTGHADTEKVCIHGHMNSSFRNHVQAVIKAKIDCITFAQNNTLFCDNYQEKDENEEEIKPKGTNLKRKRKTQLGKTFRKQQVEENDLTLCPVYTIHERIKLLSNQAYNLVQSHAP